MPLPTPFTLLTLCAAACWGLGNVINRQIGLR